MSMISRNRSPYATGGGLCWDCYELTGFQAWHGSLSSFAMILGRARRSLISSELIESSLRNTISLEFCPFCTDRVHSRGGSRIGLSEYTRRATSMIASIVAVP